VWTLVLLGRQGNDLDQRCKCQMFRYDPILLFEFAFHWRELICREEYFVPLGCDVGLYFDNGRNSFGEIQSARCTADDWQRGHKRIFNYNIELIASLARSVGCVSLAEAKSGWKHAREKRIDECLSLYAPRRGRKAAASGVKPPSIPFEFLAAALLHMRSAF
jgi:hypothetical protein